MKKFGKYLSIVLLLFIGLVAVAGIYLFFVPNSSLFGLQYISLNTKKFSESYAVDTIDKVVLNTRAYDTKIMLSSNDEISVMVYANNIGFALKKNSVVDITANIDNGCLTFDITEPYGATVLNESRVVLRIPDNKSFDIAITNKSSQTNIDAEIKIDDLTYSTNTGDCVINNAELFGVIDIKTKSSSIIFGENLVTHDNNIDLSIGSGKFDANNKSLSEVTISNSSNGVIKLGNAETVTANFKEAGGSVSAKSVKSLNINSTDTNVYVDEIMNLGYIKLSSAGKTTIGKANGTLFVETKNGDITINNATSPIEAISQHGNIKVSNSTSKLNAQTEYGNITVTFSDEALSNSVDSNSRYLIASTKNGKIVCKGADRVEINISDSGRVELTMHDVVGESTINGKRGSVYVLVADSAKFLLTTQSNKDVSVNLSQIEDIGTGGYTTGARTQNYINCKQGDNTNSLLITTTTGALKVRDETTKNY